MTETVARQDRLVRVVQFQAVGAGAEELVVVDQDRFLSVRSKGGLNGVIADGPGRAGGEWETVGFPEWDRAPKGHVLDVEALCRNHRWVVGLVRIKRQLDALGADVVQRPELTIRPTGDGIHAACYRDRGVDRVDAIEVRGTDAAVTHRQAVAAAVG